MSRGNLINHYKVVCTECEKIICQCRCPSKEKTIQSAICEDCEKKISGTGTTILERPFT